MNIVSPTMFLLSAAAVRRAAAVAVRTACRGGVRACRRRSCVTATATAAAMTTTFGLSLWQIHIECHCQSSCKNEKRFHSQYLRALKDGVSLRCPNIIIQECTTCEVWAQK